MANEGREGEENPRDGTESAFGVSARGGGTRCARNGADKSSEYTGEADVWNCGEEKVSGNDGGCLLTDCVGNITRSAKHYKYGIQWHTMEQEINPFTLPSTFSNTIRTEWNRTD